MDIGGRAVTVVRSRPDIHHGTPGSSGQRYAKSGTGYNLVANTAVPFVKSISAGGSALAHGKAQ